MSTDKGIALIALALLATLAGCTSTAPVDRPPRPDMNEVAEKLDCPVGRTPTCVERVNKPYNCFCADEDLLRAILEPDKY